MLPVPVIGMSDEKSPNKLTGTNLLCAAYNALTCDSYVSDNYLMDWLQ